MADVPRELIPRSLPRAEVPLATEVRGTLITSALAALKDAGLFDQYVEALPAAWRTRLPTAPAGVWLPIEYAEVHYATGDLLSLPAHQIASLGNGVARYANNTIFALALRAVKVGGVTPETVIATTPRFWSRCFVGGAVAARMTGPKDAVFESLGIPMARYRYFRLGFRAVLTDLFAPFCTKVILRELPQLCTDMHVGYAVSWV